MDTRRTWGDSAGDLGESGAGSAIPSAGVAATRGLLVGRVAVVTGASRGIGAGVARRLGREGAVVYGAARTLSDLEAELAGMPNARSVGVDVTDSEAVAALFREAVDRHGRVDYLINAAGVLHRAPLAETTDGEWAESLAVNLTGVFFCSREAVRRMRAQAPDAGGVRGHVVQIVSGAGVRGWVGSGAYSAAKFGVMGLSEVLRQEVRGLGIKVTEVLPGMVATAMTERSEFERRNKLAVDDVADAVLTVLTASPAALIQRLDLRHLQPE